jgi:biotin carboxyl carrier protein
MAATIKSEMAGVIQSIEAAPGQSVAAEDEVIVLVSMKMEIPIVAGRAGRIGEILVEPGDAVKAGAALFTVEP